MIRTQPALLTVSHIRGPPGRLRRGRARRRLRAWMWRRLGDAVLRLARLLRRGALALGRWHFRVWAPDLALAPREVPGEVPGEVAVLAARRRPPRGGDDPWREAVALLRRAFAEFGKEAL